MHLNNNILQKFEPPIAYSGLGKGVERDSTEKRTQETDLPIENEFLIEEHRAVKVAQVERETGSAALIEKRRSEFKPLVDATLEQQHSLELRKIEVVESKLSQQEGDAIQEDALARPTAEVLTEAPSNNQSIVEDHIKTILKRIQTLHEQVTILGKQVDHGGIEGGVRNTRFSHQAKLFEENGRALRAQLTAFKNYPNKVLQVHLESMKAYLDSVIDKASQLSDETDRNRKLVDGLDLMAKTWEGTPLSKEEGEEIIGIHETWREVPDQNGESSLPK